VTIRLVIADDQAMVRAGFAALLNAQSDIEVVADAEDGEAAVAAVRLHRPDVVLMDVRMPRMDGLEAARRILTAPDEEEPPRVLMLTTFDVDDYVYEALRLGASGFLLKDAPPEDLIAAVRVVASGEALLAPSVTRRLIEEFFARPTEPVRTSIDHGISRKASRLSNVRIARRVARETRTTGY
jgi:DNA-binding NarL/FixJ family response regulator